MRTTGISRHELPAPVPVMLDLALLGPGKLMPGEFCMMFMRRRSHHCPDRNRGQQRRTLTLSGLICFSQWLNLILFVGRRIEALSCLAILGLDSQIKPVLRHGYPVTLRFERVGFPGKLKTRTGVFAEFV